MNRTKTVLIGASTLVAGAVIAGGVTLASAATGESDSGQPGYGLHQGRGPGGHEHTTVTGTEKTEVVDAVTAKYDDVTVTTVLKDPDGSYDVIGTQGDQPVRLEVSKDLETIELRTGGPGGRGHGGPGGPGGHDHTPVTGAERTKVVDAVTAKHDDVKVVEVVKDPDGSYDVLGTQGDQPVRLEVSKDLETIELRTGGPGRGFGRGGHGPGGPDGDDSGSDGPEATPSTSADTTST